MISIEQLDQFGTLRATSGTGLDWTGLLSLNSLTIRSPQSGANNILFKLKKKYINKKKRQIIKLIKKIPGVLLQGSHRKGERTDGSNNNNKEI